MSRSRVFRGRATQVMVADLLRKHGVTNAESRAASLPGEDILHVKDLSIEVKTGGSDKLLPALRQAKKNAGPKKFPLVFWRPNGYGEKRIDDWVVAITLSDAIIILRKANLLPPERKRYDQATDD